jgi:DNA-directed RNA polymerase specialized sigma24 family protein
MAQYVTNKQFIELLKEYQQTNSKKIHNEIGKTFLLISQNLLNKSCFMNYTQDHKDNMTSEAVYFMTKYIDRFDLSRDNPFSYFTRIAFNAFLQYLNDWKKRDKMFSSVEYIDNFSNNDGQELSDTE